MYETILWATDASPIADGALVEARKLLVPGGRLVAFHCDERFGAGRSAGAPLLVDETDRRAKLAAQIDELHAAGIDAELIVETTHHDVAGEIARVAEQQNADAIVCGTRGFGIIGGVLAGSVAMRLPHLAGCPVIVVSEQAAERASLAAV